MRHILPAMLALALPAAAEAETLRATGTRGVVAAPAHDHSLRRYHQLRRLERRERGRPGFQTGANCVTPKLVCWLPEALAAGSPCSCKTPSQARVAGTIEG